MKRRRIRANSFFDEEASGLFACLVLGALALAAGLYSLESQAGDSHAGQHNQLTFS